MSTGHTNTAGDRNSNYAWQSAMIQALGINNTLLQQILALSGGGTTGDYEIRNEVYKANKNGSGYSTGDFISRTDVFDVSTNPATYKSTFWFNQTTALNIAAAPPIADLDPYSTPNVVTLASGTQTLTSTNATDSTGSPVASGASSVAFTTSSGFTGTINGVTRSASTFYQFSSSPGKTLPSIAYTVTAGSMIIDKIV